MGGVQRPAEGRGDPGHPLRHALEPLRRAFEGVPWSALAELVAPKPTARFAIAHAEQGYTANSPLSALEDPLAVLATHADGEPLTPDTAARSASSSPASTSGRARSGCAGSSFCHRPARLLGALRLPQRRRPLARRAVRLLGRGGNRVSPKNEKGPPVGGPSAIERMGRWARLISGEPPVPSYPVRGNRVGTKWHRHVTGAWHRRCCASGELRPR